MDCYITSTVQMNNSLQVVLMTQRKANIHLGLNTFLRWTGLRLTRPISLQQFPLNGPMGHTFLDLSTTIYVMVSRSGIPVSL